MIFLSAIYKKLFFIDNKNKYKIQLNMKYKKIIFLISIFTSFSIFQLKSNHINDMANDISLIFKISEKTANEEALLSDLKQVMQKKKPILQNEEKEIDKKYDFCVNSHKDYSNSKLICTLKAKQYLHSVYIIYWASTNLLISQASEEDRQLLSDEINEMQKKNQEIIDTDDSVIQYSEIKIQLKKLLMKIHR
jgi:hypothetical protein